ncbi:MAG: TetR/AcrR family transcriptional regulator [Thermodesulfobacteriota bacterium]
MPRKKRAPEEVEAVREQILGHAVSLFVEEGFEGFSMRKLAARVGVAVVTLYSYFRNKDDIYLAIVAHGLGLLSQKLAGAVHDSDAPLVRVRRMIETYVDFGLEEKNIYSLLFTLSVPKYDDYVGTPLEQSALHALMEGGKVVELFAEAGKSLVKSIPAGAEDFALLRLTYYWIILHGFIASHNSRSLHYLYAGPVSMKEHVIEEVVKGILEEVSRAVEIVGSAPEPKPKPRKRS